MLARVALETAGTTGALAMEPGDRDAIIRATSTLRQSHTAIAKSEVDWMTGRPEGMIIRVMIDYGRSTMHCLKVRNLLGMTAALLLISVTMADEQKVPVGARARHECPLSGQ
jgi:hypothetical protein